MHEIFNKRINSLITYLPRRQMIALLQKENTIYYIDDINYLTLRQDDMVLCGYLPGTDARRNLCYIDTVISPVSGQPLPIKSIKICCLDFDILCEYIKLFRQHSNGLILSLNIPYAMYTVVNEYIRSASSFTVVKTLFDIRFVDVPHYKPNERSRIVRSGSNELKLFENPPFSIGGDLLNDTVACDIMNNQEHDYWTMYDRDVPLFTYNADIWRFGNISAIDRIGINIMSFSNQYIEHSENAVNQKNVTEFLLYISNHYHSVGCTVKNIAFDTPFECETICSNIGMKPYRAFIYLRERL